MMAWDWMTSTNTALLMVVLTGLGLYVVLLGLSRLVGLRGFAKMSTFDFPITVAIGSVVAGTILAEDPPLSQGIVALLVLFGLQYAVSWLRRQTGFMSKLVDNEPLLLMAGPEILRDNLDRSRVTVDDLKRKLRLAGVGHPEQVLAVVFETTGDISVLTKDANGRGIDLDLFSDVRSGERLGAVASSES